MEKKEFVFDPPPELICPIQKEPVDAPVIALDGFTYDKSALEQWLVGSSISPMLGVPLESKKMCPNKSIKYIQGAVSFYVARLAHFRAVCKDKVPFEARGMVPELKKKLDVILINYFRLANPLVELYAALDQLLVEYPTAHQIYLEYANMLRFGGDTEKALEHIEKAEKLYPRSCIPHYMKIRLTSAKGKEYAGRVMLEEAQRAISIFDHSLLEIRYLSSAYLSTRNRYFSLHLVSAYILACPNDMRAMLNQVYVYYNLADHESVLESSKRFLERYEFDACVLYYRARTFGFLKQKDEAMKSFELILSRCKEPIFLAQCLYDRALIRSPDTEFAEMEQELQKAHSLFAKINADIQLADLYRNRQNYVEALKWVNLYGERINKDTDIYYNRLTADIKDKLGAADEAVGWYVHLSEIDPANGPYYTQRINILLDGNNPAQ